METKPAPAPAAAEPSPGDGPVDLEAAVPVDLELGEGFDALFGEVPASPVVGGAAASPVPEDPFAGLEDPDVSGEGGTAPISRAGSIAWDGADPWEAIGVAPPAPEEAVRALGVIVRMMVLRGLVDVREVADALVPPIRKG